MLQFSIKSVRSPSIIGTVIAPAVSADNNKEKNLLPRGCNIEIDFYKEFLECRCYLRAIMARVRYLRNVDPKF